MKLWNSLRDNFEDKTTQINEEQDYTDDGELKQLFNETFMLQYLAMKTLDEDTIENEAIREEIQDAMLEQLINNMLDVDVDLTSNKLKQMLGKIYEKIKYKKMEILQEIQKTYKTHIDKYLEEVEN